MDACLIRANQRMKIALLSLNRERGSRALPCRQARHSFEHQSKVVLDPEPSLNDYITAFADQPDYMPLASEGWLAKIAYAPSNQ